jgi:hypothetical protein
MRDLVFRHAPYGYPVRDVDSELGDCLVSSNIVNLDALIPREDFAILAGRARGALRERLSTTDLESGAFFLGALLKPDFQRETANWTPEKVVDLIKTFLDGNLIPAVILWQAGDGIFIIDGAHRLSALIAWVHNDYGDGPLSRVFFANAIPPEQLRIADQTRKLVASEIGSYADYQNAVKNPRSATPLVQERASRLAYNAIYIQWVPADDAKTAEASFFKINQEATPLDPTELRILNSRTSPSSIAARAIVRAGTGHKYWSSYAESTQIEIEEIGREIYKMLYTPPIDDGPIKTLDLPVAGRGYNALPFIFDLVNFANNVKTPDSTFKKTTQIVDLLPVDTDGKQSLEYLKSVKRVVSIITGDDPSSLGLHPAVYFYSRSGKFQPAAFHAVAQFLSALKSANKLVEFSNIRKDFEELLICEDDPIKQIIHNRGTGTRSIPQIVRLLDGIRSYILTGMNGHVIAYLNSNGLSLAKADRVIEEDTLFSEEVAPSRFSRATKSASFFREALRSAAVCSICHTISG